jgi:uncharacterized membrane protein YeaQ/YmgE (transglycosylase-associated protein family)
VILGTIIVGLGVGLIWKILVPSPSPGAIITTFLLGLVGAFLGLAVGKVLGLNQPDSLRIVIAPTIGAVAVLLLYSAITRRTARA